MTNKNSGLSNIHSNDLLGVISSIFDVPLDKIKDGVDTRRALASVFNTITGREVMVLILRTCKHSLRQIGENIGVSRERVRQIEAKAYRKMRHPSRANLLKPFIDRNDDT